jgi:hypothetical protein
LPHELLVRAACLRLAQLFVALAHFQKGLRSNGPAYAGTPKDLLVLFDGGFQIPLDQFRIFSRLKQCFALFVDLTGRMKSGQQDKKQNRDHDR